MLGDAEKEVEGKLAAVVEHGDVTPAIERGDAARRDELDATLCERREQRL